MRDSLPPLTLLPLACVLLATAPLTHVQGDYRVLPVAGGAATVSKLDGSRTGLYFDLGERAGELRPKAQRVVLLGLGGGEMLRAARRSLPKATLVGVDNDPAMLRAAVQEFHVERFGVVPVEANAFEYVKVVRADVLLVDLFIGDKMPEPMFAPEFWADCASAIGGGVLAVNVYPGALVPRVRLLLEGAGLKVLEQHTPPGTGAVLFAER